MYGGKAGLEREELAAACQGWTKPGRMRGKRWAARAAALL